MSTKSGEGGHDSSSQPRHGDGSYKKPGQSDAGHEGQGQTPGTPGGAGEGATQKPNTGAPDTGSKPGQRQNTGGQ